MKKTLRFSLLSLALMLVGNVMAQGVTIDFDNDYAKLFPTLAGTSANDSHDGDFTEATTSTAVDGFTVTVSAKDEGVSNANRIWSGAPRLRMYSGSFTVSGKGIKKIEFTGHATNFNLSTTTGTLDGKTWTGEADEVVFTVAKNTQINKLVINGDGATPTTDKGTQENPYTVAQAQELLATMAANVKTDVVYAKGKISKIDEVETEQYGNATFYISDTGAEDGQLEVYRCVFLEKAKFTATDQIKVGDEVIICGQLVNYRSSKAAETDPVTPEFTQGCYIYSLNGKTKGDDQPTPEPTVTEVSVAKALDIISALSDGAKTESNYIVKGYIVGAPDFQRNSEGALFGNVNCTIADEQGGATTLTIFRAKNFDNQNFDEETISSLKEGDLVEFQGLLQKYVKGDATTPELVSGHLISVNGKDAASVTAVKLGLDANAPAYNLSGQQVSGSYRGLVIKNGRKFMVK